MILSLNNVSLSFGDKNILNKISFLVNENDRVALIGDNGTGKTTLLKVITGEYRADEGDIVFKKDIKLGYVSQHQNITSELSVYEELLDSKKDLIEAEEKIREMEENLKNISESEMNSYMDKYHSLLESFEKSGGYTYKSEINGVLNGLNFVDYKDKKVNTLSGGERTRLMLGKILLCKPELILLDEPTNYLDISSVEWLENYLLNVNASVLYVSHDRYFINKTANRVIEISGGSILDYAGNYDEFLVKREQYFDTLTAQYENQQRMIKHQLDVIKKLRSFNREKSIKRANSRQKMLDKIEVLDKPVNESNEMRLFLTPDKESGKDVLSVKNISKRFDDKDLFDNVSFEIKKGEHVALIGANGTGKTTILKIINDIYKSDTSSEIKFGSNVTVGYFDQQANVIDDNKTLFDEISDAYPNMTQTEIRNTLGAFLFSDDDVFKKIGVLSGGEKCRVVLAKIMLSKANFLILDEPTNHLDMTSKQILEEAINSYDGTCLYVSHDRYFINKTADKIYSLEGNTITEYIGNYDYYLEKSKTQVNFTGSNPMSNNTNNGISTSTSSSANNSSLNESEAKLDWKEQKQLQSEKRKVENKIKNIEADIEKYESEIEKLNEEMNKPEVANNSFKLNEICTKQNEINEKLTDAYDTWEKLSEELNKFD